MVNETVRRTRNFVNALVSIIFLLYVTLLVDLNDFLQFISSIKGLFLFSIFTSVLIILILRTLRWSLLIRCKFNFSMLLLFYYSFQSQFINSWMPNGSGDVIKVVLLKSRSQAQLPELITLTMVDRLLDVFTIAFGGILALFLLDVFPMDIFWILGFLCFLITFCFFLLLILLKIPNKIISRYPKLYNQFQIITNHRKEITLGLLITIVAWFVEAIKLFIIFNGLEISVDLYISLQIALGAWVGSLLLILISGTLGTKEFFMSYLLQERGFNQSISSLASFLDRIFTVMISFLPFAFFTILNLLGIINEENSIMNPGNDSIE